MPADIPTQGACIPDCGPCHDHNDVRDHHYYSMRHVSTVSEAVVEGDAVELASEEDRMVSNLPS